MENKTPLIAITHGDPNGTGYEQIFKIFEAPEMLEMCTPVVYGSPKLAGYHRKALDMQAAFNIISNAADAVPGHVNLLSCFDEEVKVELGTPTTDSAAAAAKALERAAKDAAAKSVDAVVCAPVCSVEADGRRMHDSTEAVAAMAAGGGKVLTMMHNECMKVAFLTNDNPVEDVPKAVTKESVEQACTMLHNALRRDFRVSVPRIAVLALNPGGDGREETEAIIPAIQTLAENKIGAFGPYSAENFFARSDFYTFDCVLAMHRAQGAAPMKALFGNCNIECAIGTETPVTGVCCGPRFDIAGRGEADESKLREAIYSAIDIWRRRAQYDEPLGNPLPKIYRERRDEGERGRGPRRPARPETPTEGKE